MFVGSGGDADGTRGRGEEAAGSGGSNATSGGSRKLRTSSCPCPYPKSFNNNGWPGRMGIGFDPFHIQAIHESISLLSWVLSVAKFPLQEFFKQC